MDSGVGLTEIDQWDLEDLSFMQSTVEMQSAYNEAHGKFMEDKIKKTSESIGKK